MNHFSQSRGLLGIVTKSVHRIINIACDAYFTKWDILVVLEFLYILCVDSTFIKLDVRSSVEQGTSVVRLNYNKHYIILVP